MTQGSNTNTEWTQHKHKGEHCSLQAHNPARYYVFSKGWYIAADQFHSITWCCAIHSGASAILSALCLASSDHEN